MSEKLPLKEVMAAVDLGCSSLWDELDADQQKSLKSEFFILNRYISSVKGQSRDVQEHFVLTVNEYFNKHWNTLQKHPKLLWKLLSMCSYPGGKIFFHEWIGYKRKSSNSKKENFLLSMYPTYKTSDIDLLLQIMTDADFEELAVSAGLDKKEISQLLK